jgi:hypothetical protein
MWSAGLSIQLLLFPDSLPDEPSPASRTPKEPQLPKVTVTSSREDIKAAFEAVARAQQSNNGVAPSRSSSSSSSSSSAQANGSSGSSSSSTESHVAAADSSDGSSSQAMAGASGSNDSS